MHDHDRQMRRLYRVLHEALTRYAEIDENEDGYTLVYPSTQRWRTRLDELEADMRSRFPAIDVRVSEDTASDRLELQLGGSVPSKKYCAGLIMAAQTGGLKLPSKLRTSLAARYRRATSALRARPSFLILGAPRCGTTSLYGYLTAHPDVLSAARKEIGFFDVTYHRGLASYWANFPLRTDRSDPGAPRNRFITGEATPSYLLNPLVPSRVRKVLPHAKLIVMLRNPVERAFSHYHFSVRNGHESLDFEAAIDAEPKRLEGELEKLQSDDRYWSAARVYHSYLLTGVYVDQLAAWTKVFPREQMHVVCMERFAADPAGAFRRVLEFLNLPDAPAMQFKPMNAFPYPDLAAATRERLTAYFRPHNERLWDYLGEDFSWNRHP